MQRHRCNRCRNPIRSVAVARPGATEDAAWYHPDCWAEVCSSEQEQYERQVQALGIAALLEPYVPGNRAQAQTIQSPYVETIQVPQQPQA